LKKNIPALSFAGMFFFSALSFAGSIGLATDLFEKNEWNLCQRECKRARLAGSKPVEQFQLLNTMAGVRLGIEPSVAAEQLHLIIEENRDTQVSAIAAYERGRLEWQMDKPTAALDSFSLAFHSTTNKTLFLRASCSLFLLFKDAPKLKKENADLVSQITTSRDQWYGALFSECAKPDPKKDKPHSPNWIIRFYRSQISPAIGDRCVLEPSCSEYFHQAHQHHGLKSFPMIADRFFREPEVSHKKKYPVVMPSGQIRYRDPVENHDFWMKKK
jgi:putative component of membrane protein insertase Oxa1/YidC/SpoIIIJ protein YidD